MTFFGFLYIYYKRNQNVSEKQNSIKTLCVKK